MLPLPPYAKKRTPCFGQGDAVRTHMPTGAPHAMVPAPVPPGWIVVARWCIAGDRNDPVRKNALPHATRSCVFETMSPDAPSAVASGMLAVGSGIVLDGAGSWAT